MCYELAVYEVDSASAKCAMSSGLSVAKCPSCKIILLRPISSANGRVGSSGLSPSTPASSSSSSIVYMQCPACNGRYTVKKGTILPTISLSLPLWQDGGKKSSTESLASPLLSTSCLSNEESISRTSRVSPLASPKQSKASVHATMCDSPVHLCPPTLAANVPTRSKSFNNYTITTPLRERCKNQPLPPRENKGLINHQRSGSWTNSNLTNDDGDYNNTMDEKIVAVARRKLSRSTERLAPSEPETTDSNNSNGSVVNRRLNRIRKLFSSSPVKTGRSPSSAHQSHDSVISNKPRSKVASDNNLSTSHNRRLSLSDTSLPSSTGRMLSPSALESFLQEHVKASSESYETIQEMYVNTFSSWEGLSATFKTAAHHQATSTKFGVDMNFVHCAYSTLMDVMPCGTQRAVMRAIITWFLKDSRNHTHKHHMVDKDYIRTHLILMENPQFHSPSAYVMFAQLLKQLSEMSAEAHRCVICWVGLEYTPAWLSNLVAKIHRFISVRQFPPYPPELPPVSKSNWWISSAVRVLSLLYEASSMQKPPLLLLKEFYNDSLNHIDLMAEFHAWQNHPTMRFSFCQYPFILSLTAKKSILQKDSEDQMLATAKRCLAGELQQNAVPDAKKVFLHLNIRRSHLIEDSIIELMKKKEDLKKKIKVSFIREPGVDMGGLTKEWFLLLVRKFFQPEYGLFVIHEGSNYFWFSSCLAEDYHYKEYHLMGLLMGLAVYNSIIIDLNFPPCCFKKLLTPPAGVESLTRHTRSSQHPADVDASNSFQQHAASSSEVEVGMTKFSLHELADVMPTIARSLKHLRDCKDSEDLFFSFQVSHEMFGSTVSTELVENGRNIMVTDKNKREFIDLYVDHLLNQSVSRQFSALYHGFHSVYSSKALQLLQPEELEALICGCPEFDVEALKNVTIYEGYDETDVTVRIFWEVVQNLAVDKQKKLMLFVTGSHRIPVGGISTVKFKITRYTSANSATEEMLPMAQTCFNQLLLPPYTDVEKLKDKVTVAISNSEGFGLL